MHLKNLKYFFKNISSCGMYSLTCTKNLKSVAYKLSKWEPKEVGPIGDISDRKISPISPISFGSHFDRFQATDFKFVVQVELYIPQLEIFLKKYFKFFKCVKI